jgi:2-oxoisovalerate dehydrogenase E2 component (dihydrolipoyl transacylase)
MSRIQTFPMPDVGEGLTEAEILTWHVAVGDVLTVNQIMVEIETAKAAVELPSPYAGRVKALLVEPGVTVSVGTPIISIDTDPEAGDDDEPVLDELRVAQAGVPESVVNEAGAEKDASGEGGAKIGEMMADGRIATLVGYVSAGPSTARRARKGGPMQPVDDLGFDVQRVPQSGNRTTATTLPPQPADANLGGSVEAPATTEHQPALAPKAAPPVRKLAKDLGVDLAALSPARPDGVISRAEVEAAASGAGSSTAAAPPKPATREGAREHRVPIKGIRKMTAQAMVASAFTAPHVTEFLTVDVTPMMELRDRFRKRPEFADVKLSPLAFAALAVCVAARRTPEINSVWDGDSGEILVKDYVNLGIAAATPRGLVVPVIQDADQLGLRGLAVALGELTEKARAGKTSPAEMSGGTFTITNVGIFGVDTGTPIINPGESAILALGSIKDAPWVVDGQLAVRKVCQLSLSFDHRVIDGQQGSQFLADVGALLADPSLSLLL